MRFLSSLVAALASVAFAPAQVTTVESPLPAAPGWRAASIHRADGGVWYAKVAQVCRAYGPPEVVVGDDDGRLTVLSVYSGKWTARSVNPDNQWLALTAPADVDPRVPGEELYVAGRAGNVHRVTVVDEGSGRWSLASIEIGHAAAEEFHTVLAGDLLPSRRGDELLAFGITGAVYRLAVEARDGDEPDVGFAMHRVAQLPGRVRDAVVLRAAHGEAPRIAGVSRTGDLLSMRLGDRGLDHEVIAHEPMGLGRVARGAVGSGGTVLYVTRDDGVVLRFEELGDGGWRREPIFAGAQGLRGVAAGKFHDDGREAVAVYGYGKAVQIVSRVPGEPWQVETVLRGDDQGHWLTAGELDGRNGTDELIATGFGGQVLLLARPPGYALAGAAVDSDAEQLVAAPAAARGSADRPWRIAVKAGAIAAVELSPLNYQGGFETKSMVYETLVGRGPDGRIVPGLAESWRLDQGGRRFTFRLREGAAFHDGTPVTAADVATHFKRWVGLPEHAWLRCNDRITAVEAVGPRELAVTLDRPYALLPDLCAINPTAIRAPGALDREGAFRRPLGSGPFAFEGVLENGRVLRYRRHCDGPPAFVDLVRLDKVDGDDPIDALLRGEVDAVLGSWLVSVDPRRAEALRSDPRFRVLDAPGSSMVYLGFRHEGPTAELSLRRRIGAAIDRDALVAACERGFADPSTGWAAPSVAIWPQGAPPAGVVEASAPPPRPLRLAAGRRHREGLAEAVASQLERAGLPTEVVAADDEGWDLRLEVTHGVPYDPYTTAVSRFTPPVNERNAESPRFGASDPVVRTLLDRAMATAADEARYRLYREIQAQLDATVAVVPLYAPRRIAVLRAEMPVPPLDHDMYRLDARWLTDR